MGAERMKKDWEVGLRPTMAETHAALLRVRGYLQECNDIVDELFPEAEEQRKALPDAPIRQWGLGWPGVHPPVSDE